MRFKEYKDRSKVSGATILMGLMVMAFGTIGLTAWVSILSARSEQVRNYEFQISHRISKLNTESIIKQSIYNNCLNSDKRTFKLYRVPNKNDVAIVRGTNGSTFLSKVSPEKYLRIGQGNGGGFQSSVLASIFTKRRNSGNINLVEGPNHFLKNYYLRSRSPILSGDLLVMHRPINSWNLNRKLSGNIHVYGNSMLWNLSELKIGDKIRTASYAIPGISNDVSVKPLKNLQDEFIAPLNFPIKAHTTGIDAEGSSYSGVLDVIDPGKFAPWSVKSAVEELANVRVNGSAVYNRGRGVMSDGSGIVNVDLGSPFLTNVIIGGNVKELHFNGQSGFVFSRADQLPAVVIIMDDSSGSSFNLSKIFFHGKNMRRLVVCVKKRIDLAMYPVDYAFTDKSGNTVWRMILIAENTHLVAANDDIAFGDFNLIGGISTDRSFEWSNNIEKRLVIKREASPGFLEYLAPRTAWLESFRKKK